MNRFKHAAMALAGKAEFVSDEQEEAEAKEMYQKGYAAARDYGMEAQLEQAKRIHQRAYKAGARDHNESVLALLDRITAELTNTGGA